MNKRNRAQILPFCMLLVCIVVSILFSNFEIGYSQYRKVENQKNLDADLLILANQYARAYNSIAALNEGLSIAANRAYMVAEVYTALGVCSALLVKPCIDAFEKLSKTLPDFYDHLQKLGAGMASDQDQIAKWMVDTHCTSILNSKIRFDKFHLYPEFPCHDVDIQTSLPFFRPNTASGETDAQNVKKCRTKKMSSYSQFKIHLDVLQNDPLSNASDIEIQYVSDHTRKTHYENPRNVIEANVLPFTITQKEGDRFVPYRFSTAEIHFCKEFSSLFQKITGKLPALFRIPSPMIFKNEFFEEKNKIIAIAAMKNNSVFEAYHPEDQINPSSHVWSISEVKLEGDDLQKMDFKPYLHAISLDQKLWSELRYDSIWPNLQELQDEIHH